jgi:hypothetical protein
MSTRLALATAILIASSWAAAAQPAHYPDLPRLPRELEIELALSAAPPHLREGATVLVLDAAGYVTARPGANAFTCLVTRRGGDVVPICWDAEGTRTMVPIETEAATLRLGGMSIAEIDRRVADGFKIGHFQAPARAGISYMLSPLRYRIDESGKVTRTAPLPHVMFYGPNLTDTDIGGARGTPAFMNKVGPDGMIIVPVGAAEKQAILDATASLAERVERQLGYRQP